MEEWERQRDGFGSGCTGRAQNEARSVIRNTIYSWHRFVRSGGGHFHFSISIFLSTQTQMEKKLFKSLILCSHKY